MAEFLTAGALAGAVLGGKSRAVSALSGASLVAASAMTRFGIFQAGRASARDPKYTIVPQRRRRGRGMNWRLPVLPVQSLPGDVSPLRQLTLSN